MVLFLVLLVVLNILLWCVFLYKFKKLFSTDKIIENTKEELNKLLIDLNNNADRDISIYNDRVKQLKNMINEADNTILKLEKKLKFVDSEIKKNAYASALDNSINNAIKNKNERIFENSRAQAAKTYLKNASSSSSVIESQTKVNITPEGKKVADINEQINLFDDIDDNKLIDTDITVNIDKSGNSYAEIPVVNPQIYVNEVPLNKEKDLKSRVISLFNKGYAIEEIAHELKCSITEVQFIIDLSM